MRYAPFHARGTAARKWTIGTWMLSWWTLGQAVGATANGHNPWWLVAGMWLVVPFAVLGYWLWRFRAPSGTLRLAAGNAEGEKASEIGWRPRG